MKITLKELTKWFPGRSRKDPGVTAVDRFDFVIPSGKLVGLLGPSGCGKSTTLLMISGLEKPTSGRIFFDEEDVTDIPPEARGVGLVFQNYALYPHMTVEQNIMFPLGNRKGADRMTKEEMKKKAHEVGKLVQIDSLMNRRPKELSGGQQQRVAIARALATNPEVVLFDEPTSALDPELTGEVLTVIKQLADEGRTMIVVTHEMEFARKVATRVVFMEDGEIVEENTAKEFFENPQKERTKEFIYKSTTWASVNQKDEEAAEALPQGE